MVETILPGRRRSIVGAITAALAAVSLATAAPVAGRYHRVDYPGATHTGVNDGNTRGQLVGQLVEGDLAQPTAMRGALLSRGRLTTFDAPGPPA